jgi:hypothetical protein
MDEKTKHNNEPGSTSDEHNEPNIPDNTITIDDVLSTEERTLPNGNTITIIKRTTQTELIVPIRDPKSGEVFHTARVVLEPWATDPKKMPDHVKEDLARTFLRSMEEEMRRDPGAKARWDELGEEVLKRVKKKE